jgi:hypothetical protein
LGAHEKLCCKSNLRRNYPVLANLKYMLEKILLGADPVNVTRAMMLVLGCVQAKNCNTNNCQTGIATQNPSRARAIDVEEKSARAHNFHHVTVDAFLEFSGAMGYDNLDTFGPSDLFSRIDGQLKNFDQLYTFLLNTIQTGRGHRHRFFDVI